MAAGSRKGSTAPSTPAEATRSRRGSQAQLDSNTSTKRTRRAARTGGQDSGNDDNDNHDEDDDDVRADEELPPPKDYAEAIARRRALFHQARHDSETRYSVESIFTIPQSTQVHAIAAAPCFSHIYTGQHSRALELVVCNALLLTCLLQQVEAMASSEDTQRIPRSTERASTSHCS